jgi:hypothetical protein
MAALAWLSKRLPAFVLHVLARPAEDCMYSIGKSCPFEQYLICLATVQA